MNDEKIIKVLNYAESELRALGHKILSHEFVDGHLNIEIDPTQDEICFSPSEDEIESIKDKCRQLFGVDVWILDSDIIISDT